MRCNKSFPTSFEVHNKSFPTSFEVQEVLTDSSPTLPEEQKQLKGKSILMSL